MKIRVKEIAPSTSLRKWFGHEPEKWAEFRIRHFAELDNNPAALDQLAEHMRRAAITLLYAAKDQEHNDAVALMEYLAGAYNNRGRK